MKAPVTWAAGQRSLGTNLEPPYVSVPAPVMPFLWLGQVWVRPLVPGVLHEPAHLPFQARGGSSPVPTSIITPETTSGPSTP